MLYRIHLTTLLLEDLKGISLTSARHSISWNGWALNSTLREFQHLFAPYYLFSLWFRLCNICLSLSFSRFNFFFYQIHDYTSQSNSCWHVRYTRGFILSALERWSKNHCTNCTETNSPNYSVSASWFLLTIILDYWRNLVCLLHYTRPTRKDGLYVPDVVGRIPTNRMKHLTYNLIVGIVNCFK